MNEQTLTIEYETAEATEFNQSSKVHVRKDPSIQSD